MNTLSVLGIPLDENASFLRGSAQAPEKIWEAFHCTSANYFSEAGIDFASSEHFENSGSLVLSGSMDQQFDQITAGVNYLLEKGKRVLSLGGDHSITYPILRAYARHYPKLNILHLDAHGDIYDELGGDPLSHACPFARIMENRLAARLIQVGVRALNTHQREQIERFQVETVEMRDFDPKQCYNFDGPVYLSVDLDVLEPGLVPGISHYEPGGMTTRELLSLIQRLDCDLVGADIVELNPVRDYHGMTAMIAAKLMKEVAAKMF
ncbi:MAG: agmatinase [Anaerolineaceae bacterium]|nr:agmatinase [Anaerolineaceae bacterium]